MKNFDWHSCAVYVAETGISLRAGQSLTITFAHRASDRIKSRPYIRVYALDMDRRLIEVNSAATSDHAFVKDFERTIRLPISSFKPLTDSPYPGNGSGLVLSKCDFATLYNWVTVGLDLLWAFFDLNEHFKPFVYELGHLRLSSLPWGMRVNADGSVAWSASRGTLSLTLGRLASGINLYYFKSKEFMARQPTRFERETYRSVHREASQEPKTFWYLEDHTGLNIGLVRTSNDTNDSCAEIAFDLGYKQVPDGTLNFNYLRYSPSRDFGNKASPCSPIVAMFHNDNYPPQGGHTYEAE